jgi:hypothetical protein
VKEVHFETSDYAAVKLYQGPCSEIQQQLHHSTRMLQLVLTENSRHGIDEPYLGSEKSHLGFYSLTVAASVSDLPTNSCVAEVRLFQGQLDYYKFVTLGHKSMRYPPHCVFPENSSNFTYHGSGYNFVGLESFYSATLNITIERNVAGFNITNLSTTTCQAQCTVTLNHTNDQGTCILASLQDTSNFITLYYSAWSYSDKYRGHNIAAWTILSICILLAIVAFLLLVIKIIIL